MFSLRIVIVNDRNGLSAMKSEVHSRRRYLSCICSLSASLAWENWPKLLYKKKTLYAGSM